MLLYEGPRFRVGKDLLFSNLCSKPLYWSRSSEVTNIEFANLANLVEAPVSARFRVIRRVCLGLSTVCQGLVICDDVCHQIIKRFHVAFNLISRRYPAPPLTRRFCAFAFAVMSRSFADAFSGEAWRVLKYSHCSSTTRTLSVPQSTRWIPA
jgi:hypothetical protein